MNEWLIHAQSLIMWRFRGCHSDLLCAFISFHGQKEAGLLYVSQVLLLLSESW